MTESSKYTYLQEKQQDTADDFYPQSKAQDKVKSTINTLVISLNSKKSQLRSNEIQQSAIKQKLTELDVEAGKLTIANQYLSAEADELAVKSDQWLFQKGQLVKELKEWKEAKECLAVEVSKGDEEIKQKKKIIEGLVKKGEELKAKIKVKQQQKKQVYDYNLDLELSVEATETQVAKLRQSRDCLAKTATTLQTFEKSFKKNIIAKEKEISRAKFDSSQLENLIVTKEFQRSNFIKEKEKVEWEAKMYQHHNSEIQKTNQRLKGDLQKLLVHLQSLKKNNKSLSASIKDYSDTGIQTVKKILKLVNK